MLSLRFWSPAEQSADPQGLLFSTLGIMEPLSWMSFCLDYVLFLRRYLFHGRTTRDLRFDHRYMDLGGKERNQSSGWVGWWVFWELVADGRVLVVR